MDLVNWYGFTLKPFPRLLRVMEDGTVLGSRDMDAMGRLSAESRGIGGQYVGVLWDSKLEAWEALKQAVRAESG